MSVIIKILNYLSILLFTIALLLMYADLPSKVGLDLLMGYSVSKQSVFFYAVGFFFISNLSLRFIIPHYIDYFIGLQKQWIYLLVFVFNVSLTLLLSFVWAFHSSMNIDMDTFQSLVLIGLGGLFIWVMVLVVFRYYPRN